MLKSILPHFSSVPNGRPFGDPVDYIDFRQMNCLEIDTERSARRRSAVKASDQRTSRLPSMAIDRVFWSENSR